MGLDDGGLHIHYLQTGFTISGTGTTRTIGAVGPPRGIVSMRDTARLLKDLMVRVGRGSQVRKSMLDAGLPISGLSDGVAKTSR